MVDIVEQRSGPVVWDLHTPMRLENSYLYHALLSAQQPN